jgi:hypothetical protein
MNNPAEDSHRNGAPDMALGTVLLSGLASVVIFGLVFAGASWGSKKTAHIRHHTTVGASTRHQ